MTVTYGRELISFIVNKNVNDVVLVLVVTFEGVYSDHKANHLQQNLQQEKQTLKGTGQ